MWTVQKVKKATTETCLHPKTKYPQNVLKHVNTCKPWDPRKPGFKTQLHQTDTSSVTLDTRPSSLIAP